MAGEKMNGSISDALKETPYYKINREERNLVAILYHLLLVDDNLQTFFSDVIKHSEDPKSWESCEIYFEYAFMRDIWDKYKGKEFKDEYNVKKKTFILSFFDKQSDKEESIFWKNSWKELSAKLEKLNVPDFNNYFGRDSKDYIESPRNWRLKSLQENFCKENSRESDKAFFKELCKFKWAFNIKPDLVIVTKIKSEELIFCFEAKLESPESSYPTGDEMKIWKKVFDDYKKEKVKQIDLQKYMFKDLLGFENNVHYYFIDKKDNEYDTNKISWKEVFSCLCVKNKFLQRFLKENESLGKFALKPIGDDCE